MRVDAAYHIEMARHLAAPQAAMSSAAQSVCNTPFFMKNKTPKIIYIM
jgi:hypothetical protein